MKELLVDPQAWGAIAPAYDQATRRILTPFSEEAVRWAGLEDQDRVVDVAAGPGTTTMLAAAAASSVHAVDFAPEMIEQLRKNTADLSGVTSTVGDGQQLECDDESFSAAFSMFGLMFFPDPIAGLRELHRVLQPGGRVVISSWVPAPSSPMMQPLIAALTDAIPPQPDQEPPGPFAFEDPESLADGLRRGGFERVEVREYAPDLPVRSPDDYWRDNRDNIFIHHIRKVAGPQWPEIEGRIVAHLREALDDVQSLRMPALLGRGVKIAAPTLRGTS